MREPTFAQLEDRINRMSYKPGWTIKVRKEGMWPESPLTQFDKDYGIVEEEPFFFLTIEIIALVPDSNNPSRVGPVGSRRSIRSETFQVHDWQETLDYAIWKHIMDIELHEVDEFFKINGEHYRDPHPELKQKGYVR